MEKVKILIVEDELLIAEDIRQQLIKLGYEVSGMAVSYNDALGNMVGNLPDLVLVDINIDGNKDGIELGFFLKNEVNIPFIYLTSNADIATVNRAKATQPDAYLLKPFKSDNLFTAIEIALWNVKQEHTIIQDSPKNGVIENQDFILKDCVFVKKDAVFVKIRLSEILYIKSEGNYLDLFSSDGKKHFIRSTMTYFSEFLTDDNFFQTHQSYIVNLNFMDEFTNTFVKIQNQEIPISKSRKDEFFSKMRTF